MDAPQRMDAKAARAVIEKAKGLDSRFSGSHHTQTHQHAAQVLARSTLLCLSFAWASTMAFAWSFT